MQEQLDNLTSRCAELDSDRNALARANRVAMERTQAWKNRTLELEAERDELRKHSEYLEAEVDSLATGEATIRDERDEARQWAAKLYKENVNLEATLVLCCSAGHEISDIGFAALAENADRLAQLAGARNKALNEALQVIHAEMQSLFLGHYDIRQVVKAVLALKS